MQGRRPRTAIAALAGKYLPQPALSIGIDSGQYLAGRHVHLRPVTFGGEDDLRRPLRDYWRKKAWRQEAHVTYGEIDKLPSQSCLSEGRDFVLVMLGTELIDGRDCFSTVKGPPSERWGERWNG